VIVDGELHGVLAVAGRNRPVSDQELSRCIAIVRIMELALANALAHRHFQNEALTDSLTSLANRRGMARLVSERRGRQPLANSSPPSLATTCVVFDADEQAGAHIAARMLAAVLDACHRDRAPRVSIGVACAEPGGSLDDGIHRADAAMYEAKRAGGMRYQLASPQSVPDLARREAAA
jgi:GGDEF domain-containing protein